MIWINGEPAEVASVNDRSFQYGDGCFTTMLTRFGIIEHFEFHKQRVDECLLRLKMPAVDWSQVSIWLKNAVSSESQAGIKLHISRGIGGRGYSPAMVDSLKITIMPFSYPMHYLQWQQQGVNLGVCQERLGCSPLLAGLKHNNRLEQVLLKADIEEQGYVDGIALDIYGNVIETTMANLFWRHGTSWFTPSLDQSGVAGVMRRIVLQNQAISIESGQFPLSHLLKSDEIFMTNALLGVAPVVSIENNHYLIGQQTKTYQEMVNPCLRSS